MTSAATPSGGDLTVAELRQRIADYNATNASAVEAEEAEEEELTWDEGLPREALLWVALVPSWTIPLAEAIGFPTNDATVSQVFDRMSEVGLIEIASSTVAQSEDTELARLYGMPTSRRAWVLDQYRGEFTERSEPTPNRLAQLTARRPESRPVIRATLSDIGRRIVAVANKIVVLASVRRWATLAAEAENTAKLVAVFDARVEQEFSNGQAGELLSWIEVLRPLAALLTHYLDQAPTLALQRAGRRLELLYRRDNDRRYLGSFLRRDGQDEAFRALMADEQHWALHFVGQSGVGKTMVVRHIAAELAPELQTATARVDFDFLPADYPRLAPGLLLWSFAHELGAFDTSGEVNRLFAEAQVILTELHQRLQADRPVLGGPRATDERGFRDAMVVYIDALRALNRPIVLIVDTCEELAKISRDGTTPENVEETFRILRALHDGVETLDHPDAPPLGGVPNLRVVFAGRRLLASRGPGWHTQPPAKLPERPYLRVHEMRGFNEDEARRYLSGVRKGAEGLLLVERSGRSAADTRLLRGVPSELIETIVRRSRPEPGGVPTLRVDGQPISEAIDPDRCNPYDLQLYADWATEVHPPTAEEIKNESTDKYIELRILRRLETETLEELLPVIALTGHFDREMLAAAVGAGRPDFEVSVDKLERQEWVSPRYATLASGTQNQLVYGIQPGLLLRLRAFYRGGGGAPLQVRARLANYLEQKTLGADLGTLDWSMFDGALRVLEAEDAGRAARWWRRVEAHVLAKRDYNWSYELTRALVGRDGGAGARDQSLGLDAPPESRLRPAVLATYAAALRNTNRLEELPGVWTEVAAKADRHPERDGVARLRLRGLAGALAVADSPTPPSSAVAALWQEVTSGGAERLDAELAVALLATCEALVEQAEQLLEREPARVQALLRQSGTLPSPAVPAASEPEWLADLVAQRLTTWQRDLPDRAGDLAALAAFSESVAARVQALRREYPAALVRLNRALALVSGVPGSRSGSWSDWVPPPDIGARLRLELVRLFYPTYLSPAETLRAVGTWDGPPTTPDGSFLISALLRVHLANAPDGADVRALLERVGPPASAALDAANLAVLAPPPACNAQRAIPPLFVSLAEAGTAGGSFGVHLDSLRVVVRQVTSFGLDRARHAERARLRLVRRMRLRDLAPVSATVLLDSPRLADRSLVWALDALDGPKGATQIPDVPAAVTDYAERAAWLDAIWRCLATWDGARAGQMIDWATEHLRPLANPPTDEMPELVRVTLKTDLAEAAQIARQADRDPTELARAAEPLAASAAWRRGSDEPETLLQIWLRRRALELPSAPELGSAGSPSAIAVRLGLRRAAEIALEEGALLATRLPEQAAVVLDYAHAWFVMSADWAGATVAGLARAMARDRDDLAGLDAELAQVENDYNRLQPTVDNGALPTWDAVVALSAAPTVAGLDTLGPREWQPWLTRLVLCLARRRALQAPPTADETDESDSVLREWFSATYGLQREGAVVLPGDLHRWLQPPPPRAESVPARSTLSTVQTWSTVVFGLGIIAALLLLGFIVFQWFGDLLFAAQYQSLEPLPRAGAYGLVLGVAALIVFGVPRLAGAARAGLARTFLLELRLSRADEPVAGLGDQSSYRGPR